MTKRLLIALLAMVLCLSVVMLVACGCEHYYENGTCKYCNQPDPNYDPNTLPCTHYYQSGICKYCGEEDPNYVPPVCNHYFELGVCTHCGEADPNYVPVAPPTGDDKVATAIKVALLYGENGQEKSLTGTVYATDTNGYYINDGTASIYVADTTSVAVGDVVYTKGTLAFAAFNKVVFNATETEVVANGATALTPTDTNVLELAKLPAVATNYYQYVTLLGFVNQAGEEVTLTVEDKVVVVDPSSAALFTNLVGQKVYFTAVVCNFTTAWVVKAVTDNAIEVLPADLDLVADEIFAWVQTKLPTDAFENFNVPTKYTLEPSVNFEWAVDGVQGVTITDGVVTIAGQSQDVTIPLVLTLTCDGKTKTQTFNVSCNANYIFDYVQAQLPTIYPNTYYLPAQYETSTSIGFAWEVVSGSVIAITQEVDETTNTTKWALASEDVKEDTTVQIRLTITTATNERSKVFDVVLKAPISISLGEVANQELYTPVKVSGTVLLTAYNQTGTTCSLLIYDANYKMLQIDFAGTGLDANKNFVRPSPIDEYAEGDKVSVYGRVAERTVAGITIKSLSVKEVAVDQKAAADYQFSLTGFDVVNLATADDYHNFMANVESYGGTTIVKVTAPYLVYSGSSSYNFIRFGPDAISARDGYSTKIDNVTKKRVFCLSRNVLGEKCPGLETALAVPKKSAGAKLYSTFEIYAVPMYMGTDTLQFVPLGANFYTYTK